MNLEDIYRIYKRNPSVQTDTRKLKEGDLFMALKGPNFNGNEFVRLALDQGAAFAIVDEALPFTDDRLIKTENVLLTLQELSKYHRLVLERDGGERSPSFLAITGSNGKTTTKELINKVLSTKYKTYATRGNLNNHIGVPLTILEIRPDVEIAVIEMGANHLGEIAGYCEYAMPTHGMITNCGKAHLEGFGSVENVKKGKGELFQYLRAHDRTVFVNADDASVVSLASGIEKSIFYGSNGKNVSGVILESDPFIQVSINSSTPFSFRTNLVGNYNFSNLLAAVSIGRYFKVEDKTIKEAIESYFPTNSRSQLLQLGSNLIISDTYNANPGSMKAAIENFAAMNGDKKILMLGSMKELGDQSDEEHTAVISLIE
ncbi:MAG: UDP-N-acetylmuramoyl-tripeptide--D-alanyl-D-alanine ligase, partial [Ginsengibacter sp.]